MCFGSITVAVEQEFSDHIDIFFKLAGCGITDHERGTGCAGMEAGAVGGIAEVTGHIEPVVVIRGGLELMYPGAVQLPVFYRNQFGFVPEPEAVARPDHLQVIALAAEQTAMIDLAEYDRIVGEGYIFFFAQCFQGLRYCRRDTGKRHNAVAVFGGPAVLFGQLLRGICCRGYGIRAVVPAGSQTNQDGEEQFIVHREGG